MTPAPANETLDKLENLVARAANGKAPWFVEILEGAGFRMGGGEAFGLEGLKAKEIASLFSMTPQAVGLWVKNEGCPRNGDGTYNLADVIGWFREEMTGGPRSASEMASIERKRKADADRAESQARITAIELGEMEGHYLLKEEVQKGRLARIAAVKSAMEHLHKKLPPLLVGKPKGERTRTRPRGSRGSWI